MNNSSMLDLWREALAVLALVGAPFVAVAVVVGLATSLLQAATQLQESVLSFVPKVLALGVVLGLGGPWMVERLGQHLRGSLDRIVEIGHNGQSGPRGPR
jgi:flagellar biosynthesis protein FliQ